MYNAKQNVIHAEQHLCGLHRPAGRWGECCGQQSPIWSLAYVKPNPCGSVISHFSVQSPQFLILKEDNQQTAHRHLCVPMLYLLPSSARTQKEVLMWGTREDRWKDLLYWRVIPDTQTTLGTGPRATVLELGLQNSLQKNVVPWLFQPMNWELFKF